MWTLSHRLLYCFRKSFHSISSILTFQEGIKLSLIFNENPRKSSIYSKYCLHKNHFIKAGGFLGILSFMNLGRRSQTTRERQNTFEIQQNEYREEQQRRYYRGNSNVYTPSWKVQKYQPSFVISPNSVIWGLIIANGVVLLMWNSSEGNFKAIRKMENHFTSSLRNLKEGRIWTLVTSSFSQKELSHFFFNMLSLYFLGGGLINTIGIPRFIGLYLSGGLCASISQIVYQNYIINRRRDIPCLGASGSVMAISVLFGSLYPWQPIHIYGIFPIPAIVIVFGYVGYNLLQVINTPRNSGIAYAGHLGGALYGFLYYAMLRIRYRL